MYDSITMRRLILSMLLFFICLVYAGAEETQMLRFRIAAATLYELRDIAREAGLAPEGTAAELRERLYTHFGLDPLPSSGGNLALSIEKAESVQYFTLENGEKEIRITGPLELRVTDSQGTVHQIKASYLIFNRSTQEVRAGGGVEYVRESAARTDSYKGESIAVDLDGSSGVFLDGSFDMEPEGGGRTLIVHFGSLVSRTDQFVALADGSLTACDLPDPHYTLRARKIWLFESGDWAVWNATLYVGELPILWLPFFYYPSRVPPIHPVVGFRSREGGFVQTTTYLKGSQSAAAQTSSVLSQNQGMSGSFGTYVSRSKTQKTDKEGASVALLADLYTSLGVFAGLRGSSSASSPVKLSALAGIGISRSIFLESTGYYSPFDWAGDYASVWNHFQLGSAHLPFRFLASFEAVPRSASSGFRWQVSLPFYSDPFIEHDFLDRKESSDFFSVFGGAQTTSSERGSFIQKASLAWTSSRKGTIPLSVSLNNLSFSLSWKSRTASTTGMSTSQLRLNAVDPQRKFFYPDALRLFDSNANITGSILERKDVSLSWRVTQTAYAEDRFFSSSWQKPQDVDFSSWYWLLSGRADGQLSARYYLEAAALEFQSTFAVRAQGQYRPWIYDERAVQTTVHPFLLSDYQYNGASVPVSGQVGWYPLKASSVFSSSRVVYSLAGRVMDVVYKGLDTSGPNARPLYELNWFVWDAAHLSDHSMMAELAARINRTTGSISFKAALPPLNEQYTIGATAAAGFLSLASSLVMARSASTNSLAPSSLTGTLALQPFRNIRLVADMAWDFEADAPLSLNTNLIAGSLAARFSARKAKGYKFSGTSWVEDATEYFRPASASVSWKPVFKTPLRQDENAAFPAWRAEIQGNFSFSQNLIQYTNASFNSDLKVSARNDAGFSASFSIVSVNTAFWRYYANWLPVSGTLDPSLYQRSILRDLLNSLSIWDPVLLQKTLFKLQRLSLALEVDAHDWDLSGSLTAGPELVNTGVGRPY
ncbi:MAG: hypothetical protein N3A02_03090, partial [Rectinema sp.]|nr:hypothetical protein [Rectinema sp.]